MLQEFKFIIPVPDTYIQWILMYIYSYLIRLHASLVYIYHSGIVLKSSPLRAKCTAGSAVSIILNYKITRHYVFTWQRALLLQEGLVRLENVMNCKAYTTHYLF